LDGKVLASFPRVNLVSILGGTMTLISVFLTWWGISGSAFGFSESVNWSLWGQPFMGDPTSSQAIAQAEYTMGLFNVTVLALVFITAALAFFGSFAANRGYLEMGFASSITTLVVYAAAVSYTISSTCQGASSCVSGPIGSTVLSDGTVVGWGFQSGFYLLLVGGIMLLFAVIFHQVFLRPENGLVRSITSQPTKFCAECGHSLQTSAKFCSNCAHAVPS
jgi:hypothetical protein